MRKHFVPYLFTESPFYFEAGVNGGWGGARPGRLVNRICRKFYKEQALVPDEEFRVLWARSREALALCCGPFSDDMHHVPPFRTILSKGFGGVRAEVAAALAKCPKNDPHGKKQLETALVGLDTVHEIQLAFAKAAGEILARPDLTDRQRRWMKMTAEAAKRCPWEPPKTFFEGLNTLWFTREIVGYIDGTNQFSLGRPDAMLIDFYRADLAAGRLSAAEARDLVAHFLIFADCHYDGSSSRSPCPSAAATRTAGPSGTSSPRCSSTRTSAATACSLSSTAVWARTTPSRTCARSANC